MTFVLDNSIALAWCFEDEHTPANIALLRRVGEHGGFAPGIWPLEALNGLLTAERRGRLAPDRRRTLANFLSALPITVDDETASRVWTDTQQLAKQFVLTAYDAAYLELAHRLRLPLASLDEALRVAAAKLGVALLGTDA